jgi:hypothetical protein
MPALAQMVRRRFDAPIASMKRALIELACKTPWVPK